MTWISCHRNPTYPTLTTEAKVCRDTRTAAEQRTLATRFTLENHHHTLGGNEYALGTRSFNLLDVLRRSSCSSYFQSGYKRVERRSMAEHGGAANVRVAQDHHHDGQGIQSDPPTRQVVDVTQDDGARKAG